MMRHKLFIIFLALSHALCSQELHIPVAPNIASMGEFGSFPIGYHTGTPVIEFPFYEINLDGLIIPIKLKYNSSGIRIDQNAGWVGLGWSLETGGYIAKEIRGFDDFGYDDSTDGGFSLGYYFIQNDIILSKIDYNPEAGGITGDLLNSEGRYLVGQDLEPDLYHFNFCGYSGTFYFESWKPGDPKSDFIKPVIKSSNQYLDITYDKKGTFSIIDQQGYKFIFAGSEFTYSYAEHTEHETPVLSTDKTRLYPPKKGHCTATSIQLKSIESPKGRKVYFTYIKEGSSTPITTSHLTDIPIFEKYNGGLTIVGGKEYNFYKYSYSGIEQLLPKTISFDGGTVSFITSGRKDLDRSFNPYGSGVSPQKLDRVIIEDQAGGKIKDIKLSYSYMGDSTDYNLCRLMLNAFEMTGTQEQKNHRFKFTYKDGTLPAKNSYNSDLWGYYNGAVNKIQCPTYTSLKAEAETKNVHKYPESYIYVGANKFANATYMQYGTLDMIEYPTGGKTKFFYESHDFQNGSNSGFIRKFFPFFFASYVPDMHTQRAEVFIKGKDFLLEEESYVMLTYQYNIFNSTKPAGPGYARVLLQQKIGTTYQTLYEKDIYINKEYEIVDLSQDAIYLKKGTYRICLWRGILKENESFDYHVSARGIVFVHLNDSRGGGLRIKEIQNMDGEEIVSRKQYSYTESGRSSGCLLSIPDYNYLQIMDPTIISSVYYMTLNAAMLKFMPHNKMYSPNFGVPFIPNNGAAAQVVYKYVEESSVDANNQTTGKTTYRYMAEPSNLRFPFPLPKNYHIGNGSLVEEAHYDNEGILQKKKVYSYSYKPIPGASPLYVPKFYEPAENLTGLQYYEVKPEFWSVNTISDTDYFDRGQKAVTKLTTYKYNMDNRLVSETTEQLGQTNLVTHTKYATDFSDAVTQKMKEKRMIGIPIEFLTLKNGQITAGNKSEYYADSSGVILKKKSYSLKITPSLTIGNYSRFYEEDYFISRYDNYHNPVVATTTDDNGTSTQVGSQTARNHIQNGIDNKSSVYVRHTPDRSGVPPGSNLIWLSSKQINGFINGTANLYSRTLGWGMTLMHELYHTQVGGGLRDQPGNPGPVVTQMNIIRSELNARGGDYGQRSSYESYLIGTNQYIPFNKITFSQLYMGLRPLKIDKYLKF